MGLPAALGVQARGQPGWNVHPSNSKHAGLPAPSSVRHMISAQGWEVSLPIPVATFTVTLEKPFVVGKAKQL